MSLEQRSPEEWRLVDQVFEAALEVPTAERLPYLDRACGDDPTLRRQVELLIEADRRARRFLETPLAETLPEIAPARRRVGPYRLLRTIGRGGMGTVFLAARDDDQYRRLVAVKLLRGDDGDDDALDRFRRERQILADLEHPNIARLYDGGTTEDGRPYLVMEYVEGLPIDVYCRRRELSIRARLELFCRVCSAVTHAHRNLLVHRDLKPSNIVVTQEGRPVLLDFGIAKALESHPGLVSSATRTGLRLMTPEYASPEQVLGTAITTASDVYSLGVVLYELLTGIGPYRTEGGLAHEIERAVCEQEPAPPSTVDGSLLRGSSTLRGDLDAIVLQALRKRPEQRYGSVEQLAADVRRYLDEQPVTARRISFVYRAGKFVRRHRLAVAVAAILLALGVAFLVTTTIQARRLERQRSIAEAERLEADRERDKARQALELLVDLFEVSDVDEGGRKDTTAREILAAGAQRVARDFAGHQEIQSMLMDSIGRIYLHLGLYEEAHPLLTRALEQRRSLHGNRHPDVAASLGHLGEYHAYLGQLDEAEPLLRQALRLRRNLLGEADSLTAESLNVLGGVRRMRGDLEEAEDLHRQALAIHRALHEAPHAEVAVSLTYLGILLNNKHAYEEAEKLLREALEIRRRALGAEHPGVAETLSNLAAVLNDRGDYAGAAGLLREALPIARESLGSEHPQMHTMLNNLAFSLHNQGDLEGAESLYREVVAARRESLGETHPDVALALNNLAALQQLRGELDQAVELHREALAIRRQAYGPEHVFVAQSHCNLGRALRKANDLEHATGEYRRCLAILGAAVGPENLHYSHPLVGLGEILVDRGEPAAALPLLRQGLALRRAGLPPGHQWIALAESSLGGCLNALGRFEEAEPLLVASAERLVAELGDDHPNVVLARKRLDAFHEARGKSP